MAEFSLKTFFNAALVKRLAGDITRVHGKFPADSFIKHATRGLGALELLDRGRHIGRTLAKHLPAEYPAALEILLRSLGPEHESDELLGAGMAPFFYYPHTVFVMERGLEHFDLSMRAQYELTKRFSAEGSIRPYIDRYPEETFAVLAKWTSDENAHVRRLVSEGTRLRLPWAARVAWLDAHPERIVALLERLKDDPASLVRRSVANNLNDLGKVFPALLIKTCRAWRKGASSDRQALVAHALRSAIKRGDPQALTLLGFGAKANVSIEDVAFSPSRVSIGDRVGISFTVRSRAREKQELLVDARVHFVKARGKTSAKVFKVGRATLKARGTARFALHVSLAVHTTRVPNAGSHAVDVLVNGAAFPIGAFFVRAQ